MYKDFNMDLKKALLVTSAFLTMASCAIFKKKEFKQNNDSIKHKHNHTAHHKTLDDYLDCPKSKRTILIFNGNKQDMEIGVTKKIETFPAKLDNQVVGILYEKRFKKKQKPTKVWLHNQNLTKEQIGNFAKHIGEILCDSLETQRLRKGMQENKTFVIFGQSKDSLVPPFFDQFLPNKDYNPSARARGLYKQQREQDSIYAFKQ